MTALLYVFVGGGTGSLLRYGMTEAVKRMHGSLFPVGTLLVNVAGSFLMGVLMAWLLRDAAGREGARLLLATGVLGGFTTFSAFSWDALALWQRGETGQALLYVAGSLLLSLAAVAFGFWVAAKAGIA